MGVTRYDINREAADPDARKRDSETAEQTTQGLGAFIRFTVVLIPCRRRRADPTSRVGRFRFALRRFDCVITHHGVTAVHVRLRETRASSFDRVVPTIGFHQSRAVAACIATACR